MGSWGWKAAGGLEGTTTPGGKTTLPRLGSSQGFSPGLTAHEAPAAEVAPSSLPAHCFLCSAGPAVPVTGNGCPGLGGAGAGRDLEKAGVASAQMGKGRQSPLWLDPQQACGLGSLRHWLRPWPIC